jgi:uncharacterized repeat protein (TIGR03843 family)
VSEDERPSRAIDLTSPDLAADEWVELLSIGDVDILARMPWSSNATFLTAVRSDGVEARAVYKARQGERPLRDFPGGLCRREVAAYELSLCTGLDVVPETVLRFDGPLGEGSLQRFVDADFAEHYFTLYEAGNHEHALRVIAGYDLLANNADRKGGHILNDSAGKLWGIDNGLCFHYDDKLRTVMWDFAGDELPEEVLEACQKVAEGGIGRLADLLDADEVEALKDRAAALVRRPQFPYTDPERRSHPWPLV